MEILKNLIFHLLFSLFDFGFHFFIVKWAEPLRFKEASEETFEPLVNELKV